MLLKRCAWFVLAVIAVVSISSCGGENPGGGTSEFKTVSISSAAKTVSLDSDILKGNTCTNGVSGGNGTVAADSVDFTFTSKLYTGVTTGLPVAIDSYTVEYVPNPSASTSTPPVLPSVPATTLGQAIPPGGTLTLPITVVPVATKVYISPAIPLCIGPVYSYFALVRFSVIEVGTGTRSTIGPISLNVNITDWI